MAAALVPMFVLSECICWVVLSSVESTYKFSASDMQVTIRRSGESTQSGSESIHPYLGWVMNPEVNQGAEIFGRSIPVNSLGFNDQEHGIPHRGPDRVVVAITGGSVAWQLTVASEQYLRDELSKFPEFREKKLQLVRLAMPGYKQPQQLMTLNYMLALGAEFDVLVNIDGYNEVALSIAENADNGIFVAYPRMWHARTQNIVDPRKYGISYQIFEVRALRQQLADARQQSWLRWSPTLNLIWVIRDKSLENHVLNLGGTLRNQQLKQGFGFTSTGPRQIYQGTDGLHRQVLNLWSNSSLQMKKICDANGIRYIHILQPNQYLPNSKPMTPREVEKYVSAFQEYGLAIKEVYPKVIKHAQVLRQAGVDFHDLTMIFAKVQEQVYSDPFCHLNQRGNDLLADPVAKLIVNALSRKPAPERSVEQ